MSSQSPNIILIHWHDLGTHLGAYGHQGVQSPRLDHLTETSALFTNAFCTAPQCSPSRGSLFTGRYPHANGLMGLAHTGWEYHQGEQTLPMMLRPAGYESTLIGLQHESSDPHRLGFDHVYSPAPSMPADEVAARAAQWLASPRDRPFLLTVGFLETHRPYPAERYPAVDPDSVAVPPYLPDRPTTRDDLAAFYGSIKVADRAVGAILDAADQGPNASDTWIIFTTDHGAAFPRAKGTLYDPGLRVALLIRPPEDRRRTAVIDHPVSLVDVVPTLLDLVGQPIPPTVQGHSFLPALSGRPMGSPAAIFAEKTSHREYDPMRCIRDDGFKYIRNYEPGPRLLLPSDIEGSLTREGMGDEHLRPRAAEELYDLNADPLESVNLADVAEYAPVRDRLAARLDRWQHETGDPILAGPIPAPIRG
ncbi:sulfatase [Nonomuraea sp. NPDC050404]|uniref:sulfatase family protein n=1 Tax=Nonomuraea sp. NPDC050404 TaxID=3155783 RepID=UPI0033EC7881